MSTDPILAPLDQQTVDRLGPAAVTVLIAARWTDAHLTLATLLANEHAHDQLTVAGARLPMLNERQRKAIDEAFEALGNALSTLHPDVGGLRRADARAEGDSQ
jgi:hypothetical protein